MNGLRFYFRDDWGAGTCRFQYLFKNITDYFSELYCTLPDVDHFDEAAENQARFFDRLNNCLDTLRVSQPDAPPVRTTDYFHSDINYLFKGVVLKEFCQHISDDWNETVLVNEPVTCCVLNNLQNVERVNPENGYPHSKRYVQKLIAKNYIEHGVQGVVNNYDGCFWEIYTRDQSILDRLIEQHRNTTSLEICQVELELHYPDPNLNKPHPLNL